MFSTKTMLITLLIIFTFNITFSQQQLERAKCTQYVKAVFETVRTFLPLVNADVAEVRISKNKCEQRFSPFVVGGKNAEPKEFPESARLGTRTENGDNTIWFCGGTLISERFVLTAAHCLFTENGEVNRVRLGDLDFESNTDTADPEEFGVFRNYPHPDYDWKKGITYNDIGLVQLNRAVRFNEYKLPACLPVQNGDEQLQYLAIGWGATKAAGPNTRWLQKVGLVRFNHSNCALYVNDAGTFDRGLDDESQLCAGSSRKQDTCSGDSGGPLLKYHPDHPCMHVVVGVTSVGIGSCGTPGVPAVYTRVRRYINWINGIVFS